MFCTWLEHRLAAIDRRVSGRCAWLAKPAQPCYVDSRTQSLLWKV